MPRRSSRCSIRSTSRARTSSYPTSITDEMQKNTVVACWAIDQGGGKRRVGKVFLSVARPPTIRPLFVSPRRKSQLIVPRTPNCAPRTATAVLVQKNPLSVLDQFGRRLSAHNLLRAGSTRGFPHLSFLAWRFTLTPPI